MRVRTRIMRPSKIRNTYDDIRSKPIRQEESNIVEHAQEASCFHLRTRPSQEGEVKKKRKESDIVLKTRAATCLLNARNAGRQEQVDVFMALFHPEFRGPRLVVK